MTLEKTTKSDDGYTLARAHSKAYVVAMMVAKWAWWAWEPTETVAAEGVSNPEAKLSSSLASHKLAPPLLPPPAQKWQWRNKQVSGRPPELCLDPPLACSTA